MKLAGAPISWGVCEVPGWGHQLTPDQVLASMQELGLAATEFGPQGWLPPKPEDKPAVLGRYDLKAVGAFVPLMLFDPEHDPLPIVAAELDSFEATGGDVLVVAAASGGDGYDERPTLNEQQWELLLRNLDSVKELCQERGIQMSVHPHVGTMIETAAEVDRVLAGSQAQLCLDTGHLLIGGADPVALAVQYADRINHVHAKDVNIALAKQVQAGALTYTEAVAQNMYVPIGAGDVDFAAIMAALKAADYDGWIVMEQDCIISSDAELATCHADVQTSLAAISALLS